MLNLPISKSNVRKSFGKIKTIVPVPNLIEIQSSSFNGFVQLDCLPEERQLAGLEKVLRDVFPIDYEGKMSLEYVSYELGHWSCTCGKLVGIKNRYQWQCSSCESVGCSRLDKNYSCVSCKEKNTARYKACTDCLSRVVIQLPLSLEECRESGQSFALPLKVKIQLVSWATNEQGDKSIQDIKEQDIFFADIPVMADLYEENGEYKLGGIGTFLINGVDRVIVSQLHRSPGAVFSHSKKAKDYRGRPYYVARIIPQRGSWIDFEFDSSDHLYVRIDKKKKVLATTFLQALGLERDKIVSQFYELDTVFAENGQFTSAIDKSILGQRVEIGMLPQALEKKYLGKRVSKELIEKLKKENLKHIVRSKATIINRVFAHEVIDLDTGEILAEQGAVFSEEHFNQFENLKKVKFELIQASGYVFQPTMALTLAQDRCVTQEEALKELYGKIWPGDNASAKEMKDRFENLFFNSRFYDLTKVGRIRINRKLSLNEPEDTLVLTKKDIIATIAYLVNLREHGEGELDDIDHLGNRRVRLVGELLSNQVYLGFLRIERIVRERFRTQEPHPALMPQDFLNVKPLSAVIREFFGLGQLSQFMDQTNPLAEIAHKRRLSALGPGGVMKDRATFEIRDVHTSHYGRICPIETPEGQTIGLISSLATYATVNDLGFIETAYRPVKDKKIKKDVVFLDAFEEGDEYIVQADKKKNSDDELTEKKVFARHAGSYETIDADQVTYVDLSPKQLVSVSSALIPFLEHDDATRALMGANMQRQAVPLIRPKTPVVGTGLEKEIVKAAGAVLTARRSGVVEYVSAEKIIVRADRDNFHNSEDWVSKAIDIYQLRKFQRSSYSTWIHHRPVVKVGARVVAGSILTDGPSIEKGEIALGTNLMVAFMPWHGYNFEDAIVLNKRLVAEDVMTSVHIDEYLVDARDTKLGPEEITRDIPNVNDVMLSGLDDDGIVRIGTRVKPGDILVGKVTLKGDIQYSPEEKLLRAIFGEKSREVRDTSLRVPPGVEGTIVDVSIFSRSGRKDKRYRQEVEKKVEVLEKKLDAQIFYLTKMLKEKIVSLLHDKAPASIVAAKGVIKNKLFNKELLEKLSLQELFTTAPKDAKIIKQINTFEVSYNNQIKVLAGLRQERINTLKRGDQLPSGVIKVVKVYIAMKRSISVGDKIAGRHGNKGVISTIVPREDMPFLADGTTVDIVLNPLGIPSRMNVGQVLETTLGLVGRRMGDQLEQLIKTKGYETTKQYMIKAYGKEFVDSFENEFGKDALLDLARDTAKSGVHFETPIFDGADLDKDIKPMMKDCGIATSGNFQLYDGRTGRSFEQAVTVGLIYMMKLNHMADDKLHARSDGPYSLVTQQPLGGKAQKGGQRLGEMEVWALEAYGAAHILLEMLTCKSDDIRGRHKVNEAIVRLGKLTDLDKSGVPSSLNLLIKELQSLGLQVDLFKSGKENVGE